LSSPNSSNPGNQGRSTKKQNESTGVSEESSLEGSGLGNAPTHVEKLGAFTIDGYSRAAVQSYWRIHEMKVGFDIGAQPWDYMAVPKFFISHTHLDHIAALPVYIARRRMMKMEPPIVYLPEEAVPAVEGMLRMFTRLDRGRLPCELVGIGPNQEIELSRELVVTTSATKHTVPSLGFIIWDRRHKLKQEFSHLSGPEIRDLKLSGVEITSEIRIPMIAYTGDTAPAGLDNCPDMYRAEILITEMTFLAPNHRKEKIHKHGHMHLDDIVARRNDFKNKHIVCGHFSVRYSDAQIRRWVKSALPDQLDGRLRLWL
jgi:ribonuclease Z